MNRGLTVFKWVTGFCYRLKRPGHDVDHSRSSSAEFNKNDGSFTSTVIVCFHRTDWDKFIYFIHFCIIYNKPTRCNSGSIVFNNNYKYALHVSDALCVHHQEHYKL